MKISRTRIASIAFTLLFATAVQVSAAEKPKVRAITAFVRLSPASPKAELSRAVSFLRQAKAAFEKSGYEVETIRITPQSFPELAHGLSRADAITLFKLIDAEAAKENFDVSIGPGSSADADLLKDILKNTSILNATITVAGEDGVRWDAIRAAAGVIEFLSQNTPRSQGNFRFAATALIPAGTPFYPASWHSSAGSQFAIGLESANMVAEAFGATQGRGAAAAQKAVEFMLGKHAQLIEQTAESIAKEANWAYLGMDMSPAPLKDVSIGAALEKFTGAHLGTSGTLTAAATVTAALRAIPVKRIGYSGLMLPVLEDAIIAQRWTEGRLSIDALLAYSSVCGTGLDVVPLPGSVTRSQLEKIIGDMATLAVKLKKPLSARLLPVAGKKAGEKTDFDDPYLVNAILQPLP
ncbi:MAG: DUF711 family protein [Acidobacteria bacterium]|nr:DUF711 family protein [Acidobacteriota bacterium]